MRDLLRSITVMILVCSCGQQSGDGNVPPPNASSDLVAPTVPDSLSATPVLPNQINLSWQPSTDNVGVTGYTIQRCTGASCTLAVIGTVASGTTFQNTGLAAGTTYTYAVSAMDAAGNASAISTTATATTPAATDTAAPTVPAGLSATAVSANQINLSWQASTDNVGVMEYSVYRCTGNGCIPSGPFGTVASGTTFQNTGLAAGTTYTYAVSAMDAAGNASAVSTTATATTPAATDTAAPTVPAGLSATAVSANQINLSWQPSTDNVGVTGYTIQRCTGASCTLAVIGTVASGTTFQNTGLAAGTTYTYAVSAMDAAGNDSAVSVPATATTQAAPTDTSTPTVPAGLSATAASSSQINLSWQASTDNVGVMGYSIYRCNGTGCSQTAKVGTVTSGTAFSDIGLTANTAYTYAVTAFDTAANESAKSSSATSTTLAVVGSTTFTFVGAGDIASSVTNAEETAKLLDAVVAADPNTIVFTLGDNAYPDGTTNNFSAFYDPTWGRHKPKTRPAPGNHDYHVAGAADYLNYFCATNGACVFPGGTKQLYYSYDLGDWHIVSLNSEAETSAGSLQLQWLQTDLSAHPTSCVLAYWHKPLFSSGSTHGNDSAVKPFWDALYVAKADLVLNGHEHNYERFAKQNPAGAADPNGIQEFVIGTGGVGNYPFGTTQPNSEVRYTATTGGFGVVKFSLRNGGYDWTFLPVAGTTFSDSGSGTCNK